MELLNITYPSYFLSQIPFVSYLRPTLDEQCTTFDPVNNLKLSVLSEWGLKGWMLVVEVALRL